MQTDYLPLILLIDSDGQQDCSRPDSVLAAYLDVHGIENEKGIFTLKRPFIPSLYCSSSRFVSLDTVDIANSHPHSSLVIFLTRRVLTP